VRVGEDELAAGAGRGGQQHAGLALLVHERQPRGPLVAHGQEAAQIPLAVLQHDALGLQRPRGQDRRERHPGLAHQAGRGDREHRPDGEPALYALSAFEPGQALDHAPLRSSVHRLPPLSNGMKMQAPRR
jgi:hypothetical protein